MSRPSPRWPFAVGLATLALVLRAAAVQAQVWNGYSGGYTAYNYGNAVGYGPTNGFYPPGWAYGYDPRQPLAAYGSYRDHHHGHEDHPHYHDHEHDHYDHHYHDDHWH